jgi:hypothetical protein
VVSIVQPTDGTFMTTPTLTILNLNIHGKNAKPTFLEDVIQVWMVSDDHGRPQSSKHEVVHSSKW